MSLESLINSEPLATIQRQAVPGETDASGVPVNALVDVKRVTGRLQLAHARQISAWLSLAIEADYEFHVQDGTVENGMFLSTADGRLFRFVGTGNRIYAKGNINTRWKYPVKEMRRA